MDICSIFFASWWIQSRLWWLLLNYSSVCCRSSYTSHNSTDSWLATYLFRIIKLLIFLCGPFRNPARAHACQIIGHNTLCRGFCTVVLYYCCSDYVCLVVEEGEGRPPIKVKFEIPYFTTSGIQVWIYMYKSHNVVVIQSINFVIAWYVLKCTCYNNWE